MAAVQRSMASTTQQHTQVTSEAKRRLQPAALGLAGIEAVIGFEWLLSGLDKVMSPTFSSGLARQMQDAVQGNPNTWWATLATRLVIPHARIFALFAEASELFVALGFFIGAILWATGMIQEKRWTRRLNVITLGAVVTSLGLTANYYLMSGFTLPGLNPGTPFQEGLDIDGLLLLLGVGFLGVHLSALKRPAKRATPKLQMAKRAA